MLRWGQPIAEAPTAKALGDRLWAGMGRGGPGLDGRVELTGGRALGGSVLRRVRR